MNNAIKAVESIRALSNKGAYSFTEEQVNAMFSTLDHTVADVKSAFQPKKAKSAFSFVDSEGGMSYESQQ